MSKLTDNQIPSTGAVPKTVQNKNKRSKNKNKYPETETGTSDSAQTVSGNFEDDLAFGDQDALPESVFEEASCKRRYKCVRFTLEDEGVSKKSKDDPMAKIHESRVFKNSRMKKQKMNRVSKDGGDRADDEREATSASTLAATKEPKITAATKAKQDANMEAADRNNENDKDATETESNSHAQKRKKPKRPRRCTTAIRDVNNEPIIKIRKESISEEDLSAELENLHIGMNQNYLTNLLDDMVPACPKLRKKKNHDRKPEAAVQTDINSNVSNDFDLKKVIKWTKKRWNKDKKGASIINQHTSVAVHNLPMTMISDYHQKLTEVFEKIGRIKHIGLAELLPETDGEVFNTTIYFETEEAATKALEEDLCLYGSVVRVSRPLPPTETTAVARSYSPLTTEELRDIFGGAGPLRCVRFGQRRNGRMAVAFLEFNGPEAVQRALALSGNVKVNGRPLYVNKFEVREKEQCPGKVESDSASPITKV